MNMNGNRRGLQRAGIVLLLCFFLAACGAGRGGSAVEEESVPCSTEQMLRIVYVPFTDTIVYLQGTAPFTIQKKQNTALISRNQAVSTALMELGVEDSAQFAAEKMTLVYAVRAVQIQGADPTIDPCWRIDYVRKDRQSDNTGTIYIDAVTGMVSQYSVF